MAIGHNGGPPLGALTRKQKLDLVSRLVWAQDLTAGQKCIAIGIVVLADDEGEIALGAEDLKRIASINKRDTVFAAKKGLEDRGLIEKSNVPGKANRYRIIPPAVVKSIVDAYETRKSQKSELVPKMGMGAVPKMGTATSPTEGTGDVPQNGTYPPNRDGSRAPAPACIETPSGLVISKESEEDSEEKKREEAEKKSASLTVLWAFESYNELAQRVGIPVARSLTPDRRKAIAARLRDHGGREAWESILNNIERSNFLQGRNPKHWRPTGLDWFLKSANFVKVIEGAYGNGAHADKAGETTTDFYARLAEEIEQEKRP
jgi:hypothetical protein